MKLAQIVLMSVAIVVVVQDVRCNEVLEKDSGRELIEQGRTFVHHAMKRMAIILPAIFFKMGVAFTLLILVTIVAINNGFIGFMLLIVGLSTVLAKLQEAKAPHVEHVPIAYPPQHLTHYLDRSDVIEPSYKSSPTYSSYPYTDVVYNKYS